MALIAGPHDLFVNNCYLLVTGIDEHPILKLPMELLADMTRMGDREDGVLLEYIYNQRVVDENGRISPGEMRRARLWIELDE